MKNKFLYKFSIFDNIPKSFFKAPIQYIEFEGYTFNYSRGNNQRVYEN